MARPRRLSPTVLDRLVPQLEGFVREGDELRAAYRLPSFLGAIAFVQRLAEHAEQLDHHPDLTIRYTRVDVLVTTHDANGLTRLDLDLAERAAAVARAHGAKPLPPERRT